MSAPPNLRSFTRRAEVAREFAADRPAYQRSSFKRRMDALEREYQDEIDILGHLRWPAPDDHPLGIAGGVRRRAPSQTRGGRS